MLDLLRWRAGIGRYPILIFTKEDVFRVALLVCLFWSGIHDDDVYTKLLALILMFYEAYQSIVVAWLLALREYINMWRKK